MLFRVKISEHEEIATEHKVIEKVESIDGLLKEKTLLIESTVLPWLFNPISKILMKPCNLKMDDTTIIIESWRI